jgi:hypothetical protein
VQRIAGEIIEVRADLAELTAALRAGEDSALGGLPEVKALEASLHELLGWFAERGIEVKGAAPLVIDFPATLLGAPALLCWLEGEAEIGWYHRPEAGFLGRRRLPGRAP